MRYLWNFQNIILKFIRNSPNSFSRCHNPQEIKFLTRLHLCLSHLCEHKFKHNFQDLLNPLCKCGFEVESTSYFLFHWPIYNNYRPSLQKQPPEVFCVKRCSEKFHKIRRKIPVPESFFYESCRLNFVKFVRTPFSQNTYGRLLISLLSSIRNIGCKFFENTDYSFVQTLNGNSSLDINTNSLILNATTDFILSTKRLKSLKHLSLQDLKK